MAIDYDAVLALAVLNRRISRNEYERYLDDEDELDDAIGSGRTVLSVGWDVEHFGHSGAHWIREWKGLYFCDSSDYDSEGPFESLEAALNCGWFDNPLSYPSLSSDELPANKLLNIARRIVPEDEGQVEINDVHFELRRGRLVKMEDAER